MSPLYAAKACLVKLCTPECVSTESQHILHTLRAAVVLTPARKGTDGAIVAILPDRAYRYLSTTFFRSICAKCPP